MNKRERRRGLLENEVRSYFDTRAVHIDKFDNPFTAFTYLEKRKDIIKLLPKNTKSILDAGCGTGNFGEILSRCQNDFNISVIGIDVSKKSVEVAKSKQIYGACFLCGDNKNLPFKDESFDCVVLIEVIEHVSNKERLLKELKRVLKTHGMLIITTPNKGDIVLRMHNLLLNLVMEITGQRIVHKDEYLDVKELSTLVENVGLNIKEKTIKYPIPLCFSFRNKTYGIVPPLFPSLNLKLLKFLFEIEKKYNIPKFIQRALEWTIFVCVVKEDNFDWHS